MRRLIPLLLLAVSPLPLASAAAQTEAAAPALLDVPKLQFTQRILANGATLYAIRDTATATVSLNIWYAVVQRYHSPRRGEIRRASWRGRWCEYLKMSRAGDSFK